MRRAARKRSARLVGFQGSFLGRSVNTPSFDGSFLFRLAGPDAVDGLIVASNALSSALGIDGVRALCETLAVPIVSIGPLPGFTNLVVDSEVGLRAVLNHLVEVHQRRRIAFIRGNQSNPESQDRERVVRAVLAELGVPLREELVLPGNFLEASGAGAIRVLFDERGVNAADIDAVVAANDQMAVGATRELVARQLRVPEDLAVVGFDDDDHARNNSPPLTTVSQPVERMGEQALELLWQELAGARRAESFVIPAEATFRRSCGCDERAVALSQSPLQTDSLAQALQDRALVCQARLERAAARGAEGLGLDAMLRTLLATSEAHSRSALRDFERDMLSEGAPAVSPAVWEDALSPLEEAIEHFSDSEPGNAALYRKRLSAARLLITSAAARAYSLRSLHLVQQANAVRVLGSALAGTRSRGGLARVVEAGLSGLGIRYCCVCLFVDGSERRLASVVARYESATPQRSELLQDTAELWRSMPATLPPPRSSLQPETLVFAAGDLLHGKVAPTSIDPDLLVYPLVFADRALGYVVFDAPQDLDASWLLENIAGHLSSGIYALAKADELRQARELAEKASQAKTEFLAVMSHEVRTPLTAISGHLDLCLTTNLTRQQRDHLSRARASSRALLEVVDDILDFSKIEAQRMELEVVRFEVEELLDQLAGTHALDAAKKGLELVIDAAPDLPRSLLGDPLRLSQVLSNLLSNAIKFSAKGEVVLSISMMPTTTAQLVALHFAVRDSGIGMTEEQLRRVFRPFTQADSSTTRRYGGTGLGLSICKRLVSMMGGELMVDSAPGRGSTFSFMASFGAPLARSVLPAASEHVRVLLVEDNAAQAAALSRALLAHGFEPVVANDADAALACTREARAQQRPFAVALVDQSLPGVDGLRLIERISKETDSALPCVLLSSANSDLWLGASFARYGASAVLTKPVPTASLLRAIARARKLQQSSWPPSYGPAIAPTRLAGRKVLVVQDDPVGRDLAREILELSGAKVEVAVNGVQAVERATRESFDVILMDLHLPLLDGCEATQAIRREQGHANTPVLGVTASGSLADRERCLAAGMNTLLATPIEAEEILASIERALGARPQPEAAAKPASASISALMRAVRLPIDAQLALTRLDGDLDTFRRLLQRFLVSHAQAAEELKRAVGERDMETAIRIVHTLSSAAANVGATQLHRLTQALEMVARREQQLDAQLVADFELAHAEALAGIAATLDATAPRRFGVTTTSSAELRALIGRLHRLLVDHDTAAVEVVRHLRLAVSEGSPGYDHVQRLASSIDAYDFEQARDELCGLARALGFERSLFPRRRDSVRVPGDG